MNSVLRRARGIFDYGNLEGENRADERNSVNLDTGETGGMVSSSNNVRKRRKCIWVTSIISGLIAITIIAVTIKTRHQVESVAEALVRRDSLGQPGSVRDGRDKINFRDYLSYKFYGHPFNGTWISDTEVMYQNQFGSLVIYNVKNDETEEVMNHNTFIKLHPVSYKFSADRKYMLIKQLSQSVWRRSSFGSYVLLKFVNGRAQTNQLISLKPNSVKDELDQNQYLRYVSWAPQGNAIAFVDYNNNIHYRHSAEAADVQLTDSGEDGVVYNGIPDWVSEEEVFEDNKALWWSPDGAKLVYGVFNDTLVSSVTLPRYGSWHSQKLDKQGYPYFQYPVMQTIKYPKSGTTNPTVSLWVASLGPPGTAGAVRQERLRGPASLQGAEHHFTDLAWRDNTSLSVVWMNRIQNMSAIAQCEVLDKATCAEVFNLPMRDGWVDYKFSVRHNKYRASRRFLAILPAGNMRFRYRQLYIVDGNSRTQLTREESEVTEVVEWLEDDTVFYVGTGEKEPGSRHLYRLKVGQEESQCLSCNSTCQYVRVTFSSSGSYYSLECRGPTIPATSLVRTSDNTAVIQWTENQGLARVTKKKQMPTIEYLAVPVPGSEQKAQVMIFLPPHFDKKRKLPLIIDVYGGPGFQKVDKQWHMYDYAAYMAGAHEVLYAVIDPRGSGFQGDAWRHSVYRNFGSVEVEDTISVTKYLQSQLDYVDHTKTAIWGWSYGGYLSLSVLTRDTDKVFRCGASVAPVVRWELYDTIYTERYMSTPEDNPAGYNSSTPLWGIKNLKHKKYYLIHGTHDDNVHYQQSMMLSAALEEADVLFRQQTYPDQDHSIGDYTKHLYHSLTTFFTQECFQLESQQ